MTLLHPNHADIQSLVPILCANRAQGTPSHRDFLAAVIEPVFGPAVDNIGNYVLTIGESDTLFCAHHDTVDTASIFSAPKRLGLLPPHHVVLHPDERTARCLGADDGAGIWLLMEMIRAKVPGRYVLFAAEESGCRGSAALDDAHLDGIRKVIGFDRPGTTEIVTCMAGTPVCSDAFATALSAALGMDHTVSVKGGVSDPLELAGRAGVIEATNVAAGYCDHHTKNESLDVAYLFRLRDALVAAADLFADLPCEGVPESVYDEREAYDLQGWVEFYPDHAATLLVELGVDVDYFLSFVRAAEGM